MRILVLWLAWYILALHDEAEMWRTPYQNSSAQVLFSSDGYTYLDVRPRLEYEEAGRVKGSVNIPIMNARRVWDPEQKKKVIEREANENFSEEVGQRLPGALTAPLPTSCSAPAQCCHQQGNDNSGRSRSVA